MTGRPDGEGEYIWPACNTKQGFEWFATATVAKRGKDASDLRPYTLLSAWAGVVPGVRTTDFTPEEGGHPVYGADNLHRPVEQPADPAHPGRVQPGGRDRPALLVGLRRLGLQRHLPAAAGGPRLRPQRHGDPQHHRVQRRLHRHLRGLHLDAPASTAPTGAVIASGSTTLTIPLGSRVTQTGVLHRPGQRLAGLPACCRPAKSGTHRVHRRGRVLHPGQRPAGPRAGHLPHRQPQQRQAARHRRQLHRRRRQGRPAERRRHLDHQHHSGGAYTLRYTPTGKVLDVNGGSIDRGPATAAVDRQRRHQPAVVPAAHRRRVLHHRQPRQRTGGRRVRPVDQRRSRRSCSGPPTAAPTSNGS